MALNFAYGGLWNILARNGRKWPIFVAVREEQSKEHRVVYRERYRLFSRNALPVVTRDAICNWMATQDRSWLRTVQFRIGRTRKRLLLFFFLFKLPLLSLRGSSGQVLALRVQKWIGAVDATCAWAVLFFVRAFLRNFQPPVVSNVVHSS